MEYSLSHHDNNNSHNAAYELPVETGQYLLL